MNPEYAAYVIGLISGSAGLLVLIYSQNPIHRRIGIIALIAAAVFLVSGRFMPKGLSIVRPESNFFKIHKSNDQCFTDIEVKKSFLLKLEVNDYLTVLLRLKHQNLYWMPGTQVDRDALVDNTAYFPDVPVGFPDGKTYHYELYAGITKDKYSQGQKFQERPKHFTVYEAKMISRTCERED